MAYLLLSGATGLLGSYLLRDVLAAGRRTAVVVRSSKFGAARDRIHTILARHERELGYALPRPVVLEGDIAQEDLGFTADVRGWIKRHCDAMIHSAASLSFQSGQRHEEPWLSNLTGTTHVLELCRRTGIRQFHHISTAYVCGLRTGRVLESELNVGQEFGNDYERSKVEAEQSVRAAGFLDAPTIYRPSIIVGDSRTGYTSTFHGFYTPLKIVGAVLDQLHPDEIDANVLLETLGLSGEERKNFVPVDWVSSVIAQLLGDPRVRGRTYHLTSPQPVSVRALCDVMERLAREMARPHNEGQLRSQDLTGFAQAFRQQMDVYRAYYRDDPEFDGANTQRDAPRLPCPRIDEAVLTRLTRYAIDSGFGWPRPPLLTPDVDVHRHFVDRDLAAGDLTASALPEGRRIGLQINGAGGGQWEVVLEARRPVRVREGISPDCATLLYLNSRTFEQIAGGRRTAEAALQTGQILVEGRTEDSQTWADLVQAMAAAPVAQRHGV